jgi:hypothetical protein
VSGEAAASRNAVMPPELAMAPPREHDFALVIGIEHYPMFTSLRGAVGDAQAFHDWVCSPDGGGIVLPARTRLILSTAEPIAPVQDQIDDGLLALMRAADDVGGGRRLYVYFSGHGATEETQPPDNVALLLAKWSEGRERVALGSAEYWGKLAGEQLFEEITVFLDCCRSTAAGAVGLPPTMSLRNRKSVPCPTRTLIAFASEAARPAFEQPVAGVWQGVFTRCLLGVLRGSLNGIGADTLRKRLLFEVSCVRPDQRAVVRSELDDTSLFGQRGTLPELHVTFRHARGTVKLLDGKFDEIASHAVTTEPWTIPLAAGLYLLSDGTSEKSFSHLAGKVNDVEF